MIRDLLIAPIRANFIIHVSPVNRTIHSRLVTAAARVLKHGTSMPVRIGG